MRKYLLLMVACLALVLVTSAFASQDPVQLLQQTTQQVIAELKQHKATLKTHPEIVRRIARQYMLPRVSVTTMSRAVLGRNGWNKATPAERKQFMEQFTELVINTYTTALSSYKNEIVKFFPIRGGIAGHSRVKIDSQILQHGGPPIPVSYRVAKIKGQWKVYDIIVYGVSLVHSYRNQFASELSRGGMKKLLVKLKQHNRRYQ